MKRFSVTKQRAVTIVADIANGHAQKRLQRYLGLLGNQLERNSRCGVGARFRLIPKLHFLSLTVIPEDIGPDGKPREPLLVLEANFDGSRRDFLAQLIEHQRPLLNRIYYRCRGYPGPRATPEAVRRYLEKADRGYQLFYVACPGRTTDQIEDETVLRKRIEECLRQSGRPDGRRLEFVKRVWNGLTSDDRKLVRDVPRRPFWVRYSDAEFRRELLLRFLLTVGLAAFGLVLASAFGWLPETLATPAWVVATTRIMAINLLAVLVVVLLSWLYLLLSEFTARLTWQTWLSVFAAKLRDMFWATVRAVPGFLALLGLIALAQWSASDFELAAVIVLGSVTVIGLLAAAFLYRIAHKELDDQVVDMEWRREQLMQNRRREDDGAQNHFVSVTTIKAGPLRWLTMCAVLRVVNLLARVLYNPRGLQNIPSIHFARWLILPGRRLLFVTNYDGGWGGYLGEFVNHASSGITAIWGNTGGFPRPFLLFGGGCRDEQRFKSYARASQVETLLWYRRYPQLTVSAIERNAAIREDLARFSRCFDNASGPCASEAKLDAFLRRF